MAKLNKLEVLDSDRGSVIGQVKSVLDYIDGRSKTFNITPTKDRVNFKKAVVDMFSKTDIDYLNCYCDLVDGSFGSLTINVDNYGSVTLTKNGLRFIAKLDGDLKLDNVKHGVPSVTNWYLPDVTNKQIEQLLFNIFFIR